MSASKTASKNEILSAIPLPTDVLAYQYFIRGLRGFWRDQAYRGVVAAARELGPIDNEAELERRLRGNPHYELYAWLERHSQQFKYYGRGGIVRFMEAHRAQAERILTDAARRHPERLRLVPGYRVPAYVCDVDVHQHARGLDDGAAAALAYEASSSGFSFSLFDSRSPMQVYSDQARSLLGSTSGEGCRIVDLGCTIGGSSRALKRALPAAEVIAYDVCGPVLALAHLRSIEQQLEVWYRQGSAEDFDCAPASVDLVASHWLFHEMPPAAIRASLAHSRQMLRPGGALMIYDMYLRPGGVLGKLLHAGYSVRNNEPYSHCYAEMDIVAELERAGFDEVSLRIAHPEPDAQVLAGELPEARTHYITMVTARAAG
jgi:ubiquinone/menaquinone biosynthesis C-methylase UbiE